MKYFSVVPRKSPIDPYYEYVKRNYKRFVDKDNIAPNFNINEH